ncbi:MAG TPA: hypothetical protein VNW46_02450 [Gemmatimonadaceae bacterium]|nr:hypothetical protein [Gemmatimonadaceae bacterium]
MTERELAAVHRDPVEDTAAADPARDTLPTVVVATARKCAAHIYASAREAHGGVPEGELPSLVELALQGGLDDSARVAGGRWATSGVVPKTERGERWLDVLRIDLAAKPARLDAAHEVVTRLDALGDASRIAQVKARAALLADADETADETALRRESATLLRLYDALPVAERRLTWYEMVGAIRYQLHIAQVTGDSELGQSAAVRYHKEYAAVLEAPGTDSVAAYILRGNPWWATGFAAHVGSVLDPQPDELWAEHWFRSDGKPATVPPSGVRLVLGVDYADGSGDASNQRSSLKLAAVVRRAQKQFESAGLGVVTLASARLTFHGALFQSTADAVPWVRAYAQDTLKLPGSLAVSEARYRWSTGDRTDSVLIQTEERDHHTYPVFLSYIVLDARGYVHFVGSADAKSERWLHLALQHLLHRSGVAPESR